MLSKSDVASAESVAMKKKALSDEAGKEVWDVSVVDDASLKAFSDNLAKVLTK